MKKNTPTSQKVVRIAIIGTGGMANSHAQHFQSIKSCRIVAATDVDAVRVHEFCKKYNIPKAHTNLAQMLKDEAIDAVSIVVPDAYHSPVALQCLKAGKHVLCEKPLALNHKDAQKMVQAAKKAGVINMVNLSYRDMPVLQGVASLVQRGALGEVRHVEASYLQAWLASTVWGDWRTDPKWLWRLSSKHGSKGVLGDVGVHIVDFATFPAGDIRRVYCKLKTFDKAAGNRIGEYKLDANDSAVMNVEFASGAIGTIHTTRWCGGHQNRLFLRISGTKGTVEIDSDHSKDSYRICSGNNLDKCVWKTVKVKQTPTNYQRFIQSILTGKQDQPDFARGAAVQQVLDNCFLSDQRDAPVSIR